MSEKNTAKQGKDITKVVKEYQKYHDQLNELIEKTYSKPRSEKEIDVYSMLKKLIAKHGKEHAKKFDEIVLSLDKNIPFLNEVAQKFLIAMALIKYFYKLKHDNDTIDVSRIVAHIPYNSPTGNFLEYLDKVTIPMLINAELI